MAKTKRKCKKCGEVLEKILSQHQEYCVNCWNKTMYLDDEIQLKTQSKNTKNKNVK